ncbi:MAG: hypothetical protein ACREBE_11210 [bacterium]
MISITNEDGAEVARAPSIDPAPVLLDYITGYEIGWNVPCGPWPTGIFLAHIEFSPTLELDLPLGNFGPSCADGSPGTVFMLADDRG